MRSKPVAVCLLSAAMLVLAAAGLAVAGPGFRPPPPGRFVQGRGTLAGVTGPICSTAPSSDADVNTDCEDLNAPVDESAIAVNPTDPMNMIGSANDTQITITSKGKVKVTEFSRAHVTFDGGRTWTTYGIDYSGYPFTGDPSIAFDEMGTAYLATLGFGRFNPSVLLTSSEDGGKTWSKPAVVATGSGVLDGKGVLNDHPALAAWGDGNVLVTWIKDVLGRGGALLRAPVADAVSHDGGTTWSTPTAISGLGRLCDGFVGAAACNQTWGNAPAVSPTGDIVVAFQKTKRYERRGETKLGRSSYLTVRVDPDTGVRDAGPFPIGQAYDGIIEHDYPASAGGRQTLHDSQFRVLSQGNLAADPTDPSGEHFAVVWFDDRNAPHPVPRDPYAAITDTDVITSQTYDGGITWSDPTAVDAPGDQFFPWAAYDANGRLRIGYMDRSYDPSNHAYGYTIATETQPGSLTFTTEQATTSLSDPTRGNRWYTATVDPGFPRATVYIGDYSAIASTPTGVVAYWTDLRETACMFDECGAGQNSYFASLP